MRDNFILLIDIMKTCVGNIISTTQMLWLYDVIEGPFAENFHLHWGSILHWCGPVTPWISSAISVIGGMLLKEYVCLSHVLY